MAVGILAIAWIENTALIAVVVLAGILSIAFVVWHYFYGRRAKAAG